MNAAHSVLGWLIRDTLRQALRSGQQAVPRESTNVSGGAIERAAALDLDLFIEHSFFVWFEHGGRSAVCLCSR